MNKKQNSIFIDGWLLFLNILLAIGILIFISDLRSGGFPGQGFFGYLAELVRKIRNVILFPLTFFLSLFKVSVPQWVRTYIFLGIILLLSYNRVFRNVLGDKSESSLTGFILSGFHPDQAKSILFRIFLWPFSLIVLIRNMIVPPSEDVHRVNREWGKQLLIAVGLGVLVGVFIYYF